MKCNIGKMDKNFRIIMGVAILAIGVFFKNWWGIIGLIPVVTALVGFCPAYVALGISTCDCEDGCCCVDKEETKKPNKK